MSNNRPTVGYIKTALKIVAAFVALVIFKNLFYLYREFIININKYDQSESHGHHDTLGYAEASSREIPKHIHQIFFSEDIPQHFQAAHNGCMEVHKDYTFTFWNGSMVDELVNTSYSHMKELFYGYGHWVNRADVARYLILSHHGGIYMDMDTICIKSIEGIRKEALHKGKSIFVRQSDHWGLAIDIIGVTRHHPFLDDVIQALPRANRWFILPHLNTVLSTGPTFFWGRYMNYEHQDEFYIVKDFGTFMDPNHAMSWHNIDSKLISHLQKNPGHLWACVYMCQVTAVILVIIIGRRCYRKWHYVSAKAQPKTPE